MSMRIAQDSEYTGHDYWRWSAWIDANPDELGRVREVIWVLHPTFRQSRVRVTDRSSHFRLSTAGWGTFLLRAEVMLDTGNTLLLRHHLALEYPASSKSPAKDAGAPFTVFLSYSAEDSRFAMRLRESLAKHGLEVFDQTRIDAGESLAFGLRQLIAKADAVLALVVQDDISPWVRDELGAALSVGKPAFVLLGPDASADGIPGDVKPIRVDARRLDPSRIADLLRGIARG